MQAASIATFIDPDPNATASQYSASVNWGDGAGSAAIVTRTNAMDGSAAQFSISSGHVYADAGSFSFCVGVVDPDNNAGVGTCAAAQVQEARIVARGITDALTNPYCDAVAAFRDDNMAATPAEFTASIDWGDGSISAGTVVATPNSPGGGFAVQGCHTYTNLGPHTVTTSIADSNYVVAATSTAWVYEMTEGGTFAIGDQNANVGSQVTFWGASWASANTLSVGPAPDSFKGFAEGRSPICVGTWSTRPGNSSHPPAAVPAYTAVLVSSSVSKDESSVSGNSVHVALVRTDPGFGASPDQAGTGTVVFMLC